MTCASCVRRVERALSKVEGVETASVSFASETARITLTKLIDNKSLTTAIKKAGYNATESETYAQLPLSRIRLITLVAGIILAILTSIFAMALDLAELSILGSFSSTSWLILILAAVVQVVLGSQFYLSAIKSFRTFNPNMDVLIVLGTSIAFGYSAWVVTTNQDMHMYFDVSCAILVFVSLGRYFEKNAKKIMSDISQALLSFVDKEALLLRNGVEEKIPIANVSKGDHLLVKPGSRIPVDGIIRDGYTSVDESLLTGEPFSIERGPGEKVISGSINQFGAIEVEATAVGSDSTAQRIKFLIEEALSSKANIQAIVDKVAAIFIPIVITLAIVVTLSWGVGSDAWSDALVYGIAVLIIACPCALGLATPTAILVGNSVATSKGILIRNAETFETAKNLDIVLIDKTGTLTEGRPILTHVNPSEDWDESTFLSLLASAESHSEHPISYAIVEAAESRKLSLKKVRGFEAIPGQGIRAIVNNQNIIAGTRDFVDNNIEQPFSRKRENIYIPSNGSSIFVAINGKFAGTVSITDRLRESAPQAIKKLKQLGLRLVLVTGDGFSAAQAVAEECSIDETHANALPETKLELVKTFQANGLKVAVIGDGINDAPALAQANLGISLSTGADLAIETSGITILHGDISKAADAISISKGTFKVIRQNLAWAFGYNLFAIPIAAAGLLNPIIAGAAMAISSVSVMANSLRLYAKGDNFVQVSKDDSAHSKVSNLLRNSPSRGPLIAFSTAAFALLVPYLIFTGISNEWFL